MTGEVVYNTGNPVPSADAYDRHDNTRVFDALLNGPNPSVTGRTGKVLKSWAGLQEDFSQFLQGTAFELPSLTYVDGSPLQVDRATQLIERSGLLYSVKLPQSFPYTLTGTWATDEPFLTVRNDQSLRQELAAADGAELVGVGGSNVGEILGNFKFPEQFASLQDWAASGGNLAIKGGVYPLAGELHFPGDFTLTTFGHVKFDGSAATSGAGFPTNCVVRFGQVSFTALPDSTIAMNEGEQRIDFAAPHGLAPGEIGCIYNQTASSYSSFRTYYRAGEFFRVATAPLADRVFVDSGFFASYAAADVDLYKMNTTKVTLLGSLEVIAPEALPNVLAVRAQCLVDSDLSNLKAFSKNTVAALEIEKCFNVTGTGVTCLQTALSGTSNDYGLVVSNSQFVNMEGYFLGSRHGITTGGYNDVGSVPCREIHFKGTAKTTFQGLAHAVNTHGNTEHFSFEGSIHGGFDGGGNHVKIKGEIHAQTDGICIYHFEMTGYDRDYSGVRCYSAFPLGNASQGVVDLSGVNTAAAADTIGGIVDLSSVVIDAPLAVNAFKLVQRGAGASDARVDLSGAKVKRAAAGYVSATLTHSAPNPAFSDVDMTGFSDPGASAQSHTGLKLRGVHLSGFVDISVTTGTGTASATVTLPTGVFNAANLPNVIVSTNTGLLGGTKPMANTNTPSAVSFVITLNPPAGGNFGAAGTVRVFWSASTQK